MPRPSPAVPRHAVRARALRALGAAACLLAPASLAGPSPASAEPPPGWAYAVDVAADLSRLDVRVSFVGFAPRRLALAGGGALDAVRLHAADGARWAEQADVGAVVVESLDANDGLSYSVDLGRLRREKRGVTPVGGDLVTETGQWLLRPLLLPAGARFSATVRTPAGVRFAAPWPLVERSVDASGAVTAHHRFDRSAWNMVGHAVFGRFEQESLAIAGTTVDLVTLSEPHRATPAGIRRWVTAAIEGIALLYGRFPVPRVGVYVLPVAGTRGDAVPFGSTWYGGGPHVLLYLSNAAQDDDLPGEWVALHELLHTTMPSVAIEDAWLSEGFVTYYQEVLRARARFQPAATSWQLIEEGFGRGRSTGTGATLARESAGMRSTHAYWRVYWAGAAIAMQLDVELRRNSGGRRSLDDVMRHWARLAGTEVDVSAADLVADADRFLGSPTLATLTAPLLASSRFPDVESCYRWLGLAVAAGRVATVAGAAGAAERDRIVAAPANPAVPAPTPVPASR